MLEMFNQNFLGSLIYDDINTSNIGFSFKDHPVELSYCIMNTPPCLPCQGKVNI
jgi:hypothetical protein